MIDICETAIKIAKNLDIHAYYFTLDKNFDLFLISQPNI